MRASADPPDNTDVYDVIVVGGGLSGLIGGWQLRDRKVLVLETTDRVGGRIKSAARGPHWINLGAHLVSHGQAMHALATELGVPLVVPPGLHGTTVAWGSRLIRARRPELLPFRLPLSLRDRVALARVGLRLKLAYGRAIRADPCGLLGPHVDPPTMGADRDLGARPFADLLAGAGPRVSEILRIAANRAAAEPGQISAHYVSLSPISAGETPRYNVVGGTEELVLALRRGLGSRVRTSTGATRVSQTADGVRVDAVGPGGPEVLRARAAIVAVPAPVVRTIVDGLPPAKELALASIPYGAYVVAGFFTKEREPLPWSDRYMVVAPNRSFCLLFNAANASRTPGTSIGGGFIVYAGGQRAQELLASSDDAIAQVFLHDLAPLAPGLRDAIAEVLIQRWPLGNPITTMGRAADQAAIASPVGRIHFAADYIGHPGMDSAASVAMHAAREIRGRLETDEVLHAA